MRPNITTNYHLLKGGNLVLARISLTSELSLTTLPPYIEEYIERKGVIKLGVKSSGSEVVSDKPSSIKLGLTRLKQDFTFIKVV